MKPRVLLLCRSEGPSMERVTARLRRYFGAARIDCCVGRLPELADGDIVVVTLSAAAAEGLPLDEPETIVASGIPAALERRGVVIPVLLGESTMPQHQDLPESVRRLSYLHAVPVRAEGELDRDLGRLVQDLEVHLNVFPGKVGPWDYWLLPIGIVGTVLFAAYSVLWFFDVWYWQYAYETVERFWIAKFWLTFVWPTVLGASLMLTALGAVLRRRRRNAIQLSEHFYTGKGSLPDELSPAGRVAFMFAWASLGWGWYAGVVVLLSAVVAIAGRWKTRQQPVLERWVLAAIVLASVTSAWTLWRGQLVDRFERSLMAYEEGLGHVTSQQYAAAQEQFDNSIRIFPRFGHPYRGRALVFARTNRIEDAEAALTEAIEHYPSTPQGWLDPERTVVVRAYRERAQIADRLGNSDQAAADNQRADELDPFFDLFAGLLRWW